MIGLLSLLVGCYGLPTVVGSPSSPQLLVHEKAHADLDAVVPTDLVVRGDGTVLVLDGYAGRILQFGADGAPMGALASTGLGRPSRMALAKDGGVWLAVPGLDLDPGLLLHLDAQGVSDGVVAPVQADGTELHPIDVVDLGEDLLVADRSGRLVWVDAETGKARREVTETVGHRELRRVVDVTEDGNGNFIVVDTLGPRVAELAADGRVLDGFGSIGLAVGKLSRPTSVAAYRGAWVVVDSVLGAVQLFEPDGDVIGVAADAAGPMKFGHPTAVRATETGVVVLEGSPARLRWIDIDAPVPAAPPPSLVRTTLVTSDPNVAGEQGETCLQCHDGLMLDSREVWDPARKHHPVGMKPETALPEIFKLDPEGKLVCTSCHSPHGVVNDAQLPLDGPRLVRHQSPDSPFQRLDKQADGMCLACHQADEHVQDGFGVIDPRMSGHPTGPAMISALNARGEHDEAGPRDPTTASCLSCHAMHGATGDHILRDPGDGATCLGCHPAKAQEARNHALGRVPGSDFLEAGRKQHVQLAANGGIGCLTCHDLQGQRLNHLVRGTGQAPICLSCHTARKDLKGGPHANLSPNGSPTCVACHEIHGGDREAKFLAATRGNRGDPSGCLTCHGPGGRAASATEQPGRLGHPVDGRAVVGQTDPLTCLTCHDPHAGDKPTAEACAACHAEQGAGAKAGGHGTAKCADCHPAHRPTPEAKGNNPASAKCLACHGPNGVSATATKLEFWKHPVDVFDDDPSRWKALASLTLFAPNGQPAPANTNGELTCQSCHLVHGPNAKGDDHLRREGWQAACTACHGDDALTMYRYFHRPRQRQDVGGQP